MSALLTKGTPIDLVKVIGAEWGFDVDDASADWILWERTGFPGFWKGPALWCLGAQVQRYFHELACDRAEAVAS